MGSSYEGNLPLKPPILKRTRSPRKEPGKLTSSWASRRVTQGLAGCEQPLMRVFGGSHGIARYLFAVSIAGLLPTTAAVAFERPVVVELFTSQRCSSCPPANAYLNEFARDRRDVLALAFPVTYWDRLGWKDPFSLDAATTRQDHYGHRFGDGSYTPEIVVDGTTSHVGSHRTWPTDAFAGTGERRRGRG